MDATPKVSPNTFQPFEIADKRHNLRHSCSKHRIKTVKLENTPVVQVLLLFSHCDFIQLGY